MALSNWDILSINHNNDHTNGVIRSKLGVTVEIYKNWLYVKDVIAWQSGSGYSKPTIAEIHSGNLIYKDIAIHAERGPQQGIYCIVHTPVWPTDKNDKKLNLMVGIGCYGYTKNKWVGVHQKSIDFLAKMILLTSDDLPLEYKQIVENIYLR